MLSEAILSCVGNEGWGWGGGVCDAEIFTFVRGYLQLCLLYFLTWGFEFMGSGA